MNAHDELLINATTCAVLAADADPADLPVSDGYMAALIDLDAALADGNVDRVHKAALRYHHAFDVTGSATPVDAPARALLDAVAALGHSLKNVTEVPANSTEQSR